MDLCMSKIFVIVIKIDEVWLVIITCALSRGIYLDLLPDCTSESFLKVLRSPQVVLSNNGKYFTSEDASGSSILMAHPGQVDFMRD